MLWSSKPRAHARGYHCAASSRLVWKSLAALCFNRVGKETRCEARGLESIHSSIADMGQRSDKGAEFSPCRLAVWMGRAFSPQEHRRFHTWGAAPAMDRASGPLEMVPTVGPHFKEPTKAPMDAIVSPHLGVTTKAPKARTISAWGNAPGAVETKKEQGL